MDTSKHPVAKETTAKRRYSSTPADALTLHAVNAALDKKADDVVIIDMRAVSGVADYFVICSGASDIQVKAICEHIEERIRYACQERPWHREGEQHRQWVLLDYVDLVVHVFSPERRAFYDLERLWSDAPLARVPPDGTAADALALLPSISVPR